MMRLPCDRDGFARHEARQPRAGGALDDDLGGFVPLLADR